MGWKYLQTNILNKVGWSLGNLYIIIYISLYFTQVHSIEIFPNIISQTQTVSFNLAIFLSDSLLSMNAKIP